MEIINIAAYKFIDIPEPAAWRKSLKVRCEQLGVLGSILLSPEGINLFLAGDRAGIDSFGQFLRHDEMFGARFTDIAIKESISENQPFRRIVVSIKNEIITMNHPDISPAKLRAPSIAASILKKWLDQGHDDNGRELVLLDTRNKFEVNIGTFEGAVDFGIEKFSGFPQAFRDTADDIKNELRDRTVVSFCTGGIRCEKAALFLRESNINVFQLDGGILRYFEEVGGAHWRGECFVFDRRVALDPSLNPTKHDYEITANPDRNDQYLKWKDRRSDAH